MGNDFSVLRAAFACQTFKNHPNEHVLRYLDILIGIHKEKFNQFQRDMEREFLERRNDA